MPLSNFVLSGFGFVQHSIAILYHELPNPNITIRNFFTAVVQPRLGCSCGGGNQHTRQKVSGVHWEHLEHLGRGTACPAGCSETQLNAVLWIPFTETQLNAVLWIPFAVRGNSFSHVVDTVVRLSVSIASSLLAPGPQARRRTRSRRRCTRRS